MEMLNPKALITRLRISGRWIIIVDDGGRPIIGQAWSPAEAAQYLLDLVDKCAAEGEDNDV
jgi:hypothetical protein